MSITNNEIKYLRQLYQAKYRKEYNKFIVEGPHLINEAKLYGDLDLVYTTTDTIEGKLITTDQMKKICNTDSVVKAIGVCNFINKNELSDKVLLLDRIQDPGNLGTLMRSAVAFNFNTIVYNKGTVDIYNDKVIRASQGAIFKLNFINLEIEDFIDKYHDSYDIYATDVTNGIDVKNVGKTSKVALILGNEGQGVATNIKEKLNKNLYIKTENTESLNVSIAGSILMYELNNKI